MKKSLFILIACMSFATAEISAQNKPADKQPAAVEAAAPAAKGAAKDAAAAPADATTASDTAMATAVDDELLADGEESVADSLLLAEAEGGAYVQLKTKFLEGGAGFMSLVALALIIGLTICIERIIYLTLSEIDVKKFMAQLEAKLKNEGVEAAKTLCRDTRGPVASICYQGLLRINETKDNIERSIYSYGSLQIANMERGCKWITLLIAMAPSLGFLGTVIGMVMAFDQIQTAGDISPTIVASGMKFALITTIFGIVTALILQLFYNYVLSKIDHLTTQMEEASITLMDIIQPHQSAHTPI